MKITALLGSLGALAACTAGTVDTAEALSPFQTTYVSVRQDPRKCPSPLCGGYFVRDVNQAGPERYVASFDFAPAGLDDETIARALEAPEALVLRGKLGPLESHQGTRTFRVIEAYRGLPGVRAATSDALYVARNREPPLMCLVAPCDNQIATELNHSSTENFTSFSVDAAALPWVDKAWLMARIQNHGAIAAGHFEKGQHFEGGDERVLSASQVYVRLPDLVGPCPDTIRPACIQGRMATYTRSPDRCLVFDACVEPGFCPQYIAVCAEGYTLASWASSPAGCLAFACDPTFVTK